MNKEMLELVKAGKAKPIQVWVKMADEWKCVFSAHSPPEARYYAYEAVAKDPTRVQRVEIRDLTGVLETVFDQRWMQE